MLHGDGELHHRGFAVFGEGLNGRTAATSDGQVKHPGNIVVRLSQAVVKGSANYFVRACGVWGVGGGGAIMCER